MFPTDDHGTLMMDNRADVNLTDDLFPRNHIAENDSVMLEVTNVTNVDKIVRDECADVNLNNENFFVTDILTSIQMTTMMPSFLVMMSTVTSFHLKNVDYSFSSDTNNDANNAITPLDCVTPISSSRASKYIVHPSHKTSNMDPSPTKSVSIETSNGGKKETIIFPRLEKMENSIIIINSTTGDAELDTLARISNTSGKTPGYKGAMPSKVSRELNHESSPIDSNPLNDTKHPALHEAQVLPLSNEQTGKISRPKKLLYQQRAPCLFQQVNGVTYFRVGL